MNEQMQDQSLKSNDILDRIRLDQENEQRIRFEVERVKSEQSKKLAIAAEYYEGQYSDLQSSKWKSVGTVFLVTLGIGGVLGILFPPAHGGGEK